MIVDKIQNASLYYGIGKSFERALKFLETTSFDSILLGRYEIESDEIYYMLQEYISKDLENGKWEAHRKYADIQFVISGIEKIGIADISGFKEELEYDHSNDFQILQGSGDFVTMTAGSFAILFPSDVHMPGIRFEESKDVRKIVVKVKL